MHSKIQRYLPSPKIHIWQNFHEVPMSSFYMKLLITDRQTNAGYYITSLAEVHTKLVV